MSEAQGRTNTPGEVHGPISGPAHRLRFIKSGDKNLSIIYVDHYKEDSGRR